MPEHVRISRIYPALALAIIAGLSAYLFYPTLFLGKSLAHGDNIHHGYAFLKFHHDVIHRGLSPLWTNLIYGGHALFAESQAGLSNPVNYLVAWLLPPAFGHNLLHWLAMTAFGTGCYGLCRTLAIGPASALFAALAATFSSLVIHSNTNMTAMEALAWIPLTLWAFEAWLTQPDGRRAALFGASTAMMLFSGYPQLLHGTVIYMFASMCSLFRGQPFRRALKDNLHKYWRTGMLAMILCTGISAIQWLPLLELASLSHRQEGVAAPTFGAPEFHLRGLLYATDNFTLAEGKPMEYFPNVGSLLVCVFASLCLLVPGGPRLSGHVLATLLLVNLGLGAGSPIYDALTRFHLIPGISSFRIMFPYFLVSIVGIAVMAASAIDGLARLNTRALFLLLKDFRVGSLALLWGLVIYLLLPDNAPALNHVVLGAALLSLLLLAAIAKQRLFPLCCLVLLLSEIFFLKLNPFGTVDSRLLTQPPPAARYIDSLEDAAFFRHYQLGLVPLTFTSPWSDQLAPRAAHEIGNLVASANLIWDVPSFSGALALKSHRKPMTNDAVELEILGQGDNRPGHRLMDVLSIRWISKNLPGSTTSKLLTPVRDEDGKPIMWENPHARPVIQTYHDARLVAGPEQALAALQNSNDAILHIEAGADELAGAPLVTADQPVHLRNIRVEATRYRFVANSTSGFWLFLADTWYPGWKAEIDDSPVQVYPAQVLGKAIFVPPGQHGIKIYFRSDSFRLGALVSILTAIGLLVFCARALYPRARTKKAREQEESR